MYIPVSKIDHEEGTNQARRAVQAEYKRLAGSYDTRWARYVMATAISTAARISACGTGRALDVGCGTGFLLSHLARERPELGLVGLEATSAMLERARPRLPRSVPLVLGCAEKLPFAGSSFDIVLSANVLHYLRRPVEALREAWRALRPGGELLVTDWCDDYLACRCCDWWLRLFNRAHFRSYGHRELAALYREAGLPAPRIETYKINWLWGLMTAVTRKPR